MDTSGPTTETDYSISLMDNPSQIQEVTLDHDGSLINSTGLRSPGGPMRGRSVKEFEEQLTSLKKENFELKLRIYFLEEKMGTDFSLDKDNITKKYIELQVDFANLRKDMEEKQELLCQAVKAMELEDKEHKKYVLEKEEQLNSYQQEIEDLRIQLHDARFETEATSTKSETGFFSSKSYGLPANEVLEKVKMLENELHLEKQNNASYQLMFQAKEEANKQLRQEIECSNNKVQLYADQLKAIQGKLDATYSDNQNLSKKLMNEARRIDEITDQYQELKKKYNNVKVELEREYKKSERVKSAGHSRVSELETENEKLRHLLREYQDKLETSLTEIRKNQNLAVSTCPPAQTHCSPTDEPCISVQNAAAPAGAAQKDPLYVQIVSSSNTGLDHSSSSASISSFLSSPKKYDNVDLEYLLAAARHDEIHSVFDSLKNDYNILKQKAAKLKGEQMKVCDMLATMVSSKKKVDEEIQQYQLKIKNLEKELESVVSKPTSDGDGDNSLNVSQEKSTEESVVSDEQKSLESDNEIIEELKTQIEILKEIQKEKDRQFQIIKDQHSQLLTVLQEKENKVTQLENDLIEKDETASEKQCNFYKNEIEDKQKEIDRLAGHLKKCSCYLQEIVNKELWEKNKEIEKLHSRQVNSPEIVKLRKKEQQLKVLVEKISELGLDTKLKQELDINDLPSYHKNLHDEQNKQLELIEQLKAQVKVLENELDKSERLRHDSNEVCNLLNIRLEELAVFLDSLLKNKSVLGFLGTQKERKLREIVNTSLDLSKSFNMSLLLNADNSLTHLSNLSSILKCSNANEEEVEESYETLSIIPDNVTLTYQNHLHRKRRSQLSNDDVVAVLRNQIVDLKSELQLRDIELNRLNANSKLSETDEQACKNLNQEVCKIVTQKHHLPNYQSECASESEGWSEPDRDVSRARMGINESLNLSPNAKSVRFSESTDDDSLSVSALCKKRLEAEESDAKIELAKRTEQLEDLKKQLLNSVTNEEHKDVIEQKEKEMKTLENNLKKNLQDLADQLDQARQTINDMELSNSEKLKSLKENYETQIKNLENHYVDNYCKKSDVENKLDGLNRIIEELTKKIKCYDDILEASRNKEREYDNRIVEYQQMVSNLKKELDKSNMEYSDAVLQMNRLANIKTSLEQDLKRCTDKERELKQQMEEIRTDVCNLTVDYQQKISALHKQNSELRVKISSLESNNAELHNRFVRGHEAKQHLSSTMPNVKSDIHFQDFSGFNGSRNRERVETERQEANASPDLGIESDQGRMSSLEIIGHVTTRPLLQTLELTESMNNMLEQTKPMQNVPCCQVCSQKLMEMEKDNTDLKKKLLRMRRALEESANQLSLANQRKKEVEKTICKQIHKTSQVLRKAKANLDSGSENDVFKM